jgi:hypothetical protein
LPFLLANPVVRQASGGTAKRRIAEEYEWQKIAPDIQKTYFQLMEWRPVGAPAKKSNVSVASISEAAAPEHRAA